MQSASGHILSRKLTSYNNFAQEIAMSFKLMGILESIIVPIKERLCCQIEGSKTPELAVFLLTYQEDNKEE